MTINKFPPRAGRWAISKLNNRPSVGTKSSSTDNCTPIRVNGTIVGEVRADVYYKNVVRKRHLYRIYNGYAFDVQTLEDAKQAGAKFVQNTEQDTGDIYMVPIEIIFQYGIRLPDKGHGKQICLNLKYWTCNSGTPAVQLTLWG